MKIQIKKAVTELANQIKAEYIANLEFIGNNPNEYLRNYRKLNTEQDKLQREYIALTQTQIV